jgi:hypothetical protein
MPKDHHGRRLSLRPISAANTTVATDVPAGKQRARPERLRLDRQRAVSAADDATPVVSPLREIRKKRSAEKHQRWKELRDAGSTYGEIVLTHKEETGEEVSRTAVINALKKLGK